MYNKMITMRLLWVLDNVEGLREAADRNEVSSMPYGWLWNVTKTDCEDNVWLCGQLAAL